MKYKVITTCAGFKGQHWKKDTIVEIDPKENPPKHFVPLEQVAPTLPKAEPHRTEAREIGAGKTLGVQGGMAVGLEDSRIDRIMTVDKVPNNVANRIKAKREDKKKMLDLRKNPTKKKTRTREAG